MGFLQKLFFWRKKEKRDGDKKKREPPPHLKYLISILSFFGFLGYTLTKNTIANRSFFSDEPYVFYMLVLSFSITYYFFAKASVSPGYCEKEPENTEGLFFCEAVGFHIPFRSCYCRTCKKVILRRDHHCPWTGNCVGRDNHVPFFFFCLMEPAQCLFVFIDELITVYNNIYQPNFIMGSWHAVYTLGITAFAIYFVGRLCFQNIIAIYYNVTVWESLGREKIDYMKSQPIDVNPFNLGFKNNLIEFFTMARDKKEWTNPQQMNLQILRKSGMIHFDKSNH